MRGYRITSLIYNVSTNLCRYIVNIKVTMELQINQWGNSLALRIPASVAKQMHLNKGSKISLVVDDAGKAAIQTLPEAKPTKTFAQIFAELKLTKQ